MPKKRKNILIRTNSSSIIGAGHIMRCLTLASKFTNTSIVFCVEDLIGNLNHLITDKNYKYIIAESNSPLEVISIIKKNEIDWLIIDSYDINYQYEKIIKAETMVKILSFDDTYQKHECDILLNHNISANKKEYLPLVPKKCKLLCGSKYTLIRDEFIKEKNNKRKLNKEYKRVFISMGGADVAKLNIPIINTLLSYPNIKVILVTTSANNEIAKIKQYVKHKSNIELHINTTEIALLMNKSDFGITTTSSTIHEFLYMELPFIAIKIIDNQERMFNYLKENKYSVMQHYNQEEFSLNLNNFLN